MGYIKNLKASENMSGIIEIIVNFGSFAQI